MRYFFGLFLSLLVGCNTVEITSVRTKDKCEDAQRRIYIADVISANFTPEAQSAVSEIKIYEGFHFYSYVAGVNFWSDLASFLTFNGIGRKIITSQGTLNESTTSTIIHEYVHHLDDMDRDGEIEIIDHQEFWRTFLEMRRATATREATEFILEKSDRFITNTFGIGPLSEIIAYTASWIIENPELCPLYMHQVFSRILSVSHRKTILSLHGYLN